MKFTKLLILLLNCYSNVLFAQKTFFENEDIKIEFPKITFDTTIKKSEIVFRTVMSDFENIRYSIVISDANQSNLKLEDFYKNGRDGAIKNFPNGKLVFEKDTLINSENAKINQISYEIDGEPTFANSLIILIGSKIYTLQTIHSALIKVENPFYKNKVFLKKINKTTDDSVKSAESAEMALTAIFIFLVIAGVIYYFKSKK